MVWKGSAISGLKQGGTPRRSSSCQEAQENPGVQELRAGGAGSPPPQCCPDPVLPGLLRVLRDSGWTNF